MPLPPKRCWLPLLVLVLASGPCPVSAQQVPTKPSSVPTKPPSAPAAAKPAAPPPPAAKTPVPDYGGRESPVMPTDAAGTAMPNPLGQAGRALEALVIVLVGVVGVLYLLKRASLGGATQAAPAWLKPLLGPKTAGTSAVSPAVSPITLAVVQSQTLPGAGGATLHLLSVGDKTLLLVGATPHTVNLLAEWDSEALTPNAQEARTEQAAFADYLTRAGVIHAPGPAHAAEGRIGASADRLQDLLARSRQHSSEETPS